MTPPTSSKLDWTRRAALHGLAAMSVGGSFPILAQASDGGALHEVVAGHVRTLAGQTATPLRLLLPNGFRANVRPIIDTFEQLTGVAVKASETPVDEINTALSLDALSGAHSYDVALPATFGLPDLAASGAILPLTGYARRYEPPGFRDGILYATGDSFDGNLYGFQTDGDAYVMFYHKGLLEDPDEQARYADRFGVALKPPNTWAELDRQMAYFNRPDEGLWGGLLFRTPDYLAWEWWIRFHAKGVWPFSGEMEPQIASDAGVAALEEMIRATEHLCPDVAHLGLFENWERYSRGDVYCNIGWGGLQKFVQSRNSVMRGNMVFGPTPGGMVRDQLLLGSFFNWGKSYVVTSTSPMPEIAYLFTLFASSPQMTTLAVRQKDGFFDPFRPEHYQDAGINAAYTPEFLKVHRASLVSAIPDLYIAEQSEYFHVLGRWIGRALSGEVRPNEALDLAAKRWRMITNGAGRDKQRERWAHLRSKYPLDVSRLLRNVG